MNETRCPYCIEAGGFRKLMHRDDSMVCDNCGHQVLDRPSSRCSCEKCVEQFSFAVTVASDTYIDVLGLAITQCATSLFEPDGIVLNPKDYSKIQRIKTTSTNEYIFSDPHSCNVD